MAEPIHGEVHVRFVPRWMVPVWIAAGAAIVGVSWQLIKSLGVNTMVEVPIIIAAFFIPALIVVDKKCPVSVDDGGFSIDGKLRVRGPLSARRVGQPKGWALSIEGTNGSVLLLGLDDDGTERWRTAASTGPQRIVVSKYGEVQLALAAAIGVGALIALIKAITVDADFATRILPPAIGVAVAAGAVFYGRSLRTIVELGTTALVVSFQGKRDTYALADIELVELVLTDRSAEGIRLKLRDGATVTIPLPSTPATRHTARVEGARDVLDSLERALASGALGSGYRRSAAPAPRVISEAENPETPETPEDS